MIHPGQLLTIGVVSLFTESMSIIIVISTTVLNKTKHAKREDEKAVKTK